ncbi:MAG: FecR family protein [Flavobacteriaceae bacterium]|nr:FecR family protein [Flavobacteriaceae bacterium]
MGKRYEEDGFLAKWADQSLPKKDQEAFLKDKEYHIFKAILDGTDNIVVPAYNGNALFNKVKQAKLKQQKATKVIPLWAYAVAASVVLLIGSVFYFNANTSKYNTDFGEQLAIALPDGSNVILNANSELDYHKDNWNTERAISLNGSAFFKVKKGSTFTVKTKNGLVTVLGTEFTTNSRNKSFEVICYKGSVKVTIAKEEVILNLGEGLRTIGKGTERFTTKEKTPSWIYGETIFENAPMQQVISALENQYEISINSKDVAIAPLRFTGRFTHDNLEKALLSVFGPHHIKFKIEHTKEVRIYK